MKKFKVVVARRAQEDIRQTARFIRAHSGEQAKRWTRGMANAVASLKEHPERCPAAREASAALGQELRQLMFLTHRIVFWIDKEARIVNVVHVRHGKRRNAEDDPHS
jgi:plasmid stabilization system protein ParE